MKYNFDEVIDRNGSNCLKYDDLKTFFGEDNLLPLWVADTDFRVPEFITNAIQRRLEHPVLGYSYRNADFYSAIQSWVDKRGNWKIEKEWIDFSAGVVAGISFSINALTRPGEAILIQTPVYPPFSDTVLKNNRQLMTNELINNNGYYEIDFEDFEQKLKEVSLFILCNPHNPVGRVFTKEELTRMGELCIKHDVFIVSDEIHSDIIMKPYKHIHLASLSPEIARRTVTLLAPSKTFNVAGLSTSVTIISNPKIRKAYCYELCKYHIGHGNIFGTEALTAGYVYGAEWVDQLNDYLKLNIDYVLDYCQKNMPKLNVIKPEATFLMWLDFKGLDIDEDTLFDSLLHDAKVALNKGSDYGISGKGFMRLNIGAPMATIKEAMKRIQVTYDKFK